MMGPDDHERLRQVGLGAGLDRVGFASADPFTETRVVLEARKRGGLHGGMQFTYRNPARSTEPARVVFEARALVVGAMAYPATDAERPTTDVPMARVARYACDDHYGALRLGLEAVASSLRADGWAARVVLDDNALVDRAAAQRAGLGWFGKNANVLVEGFGSSVVLGSVVTDAPLRPDRPAVDGCGTCARCLDSCPTGALVAPGVLDARRCLAWLVQSVGTFPVEHRVALGDRLYGCDDCQDACPPTVRFGRRGTVAAAAPDATFVSVLALLDASDDELLVQFGRWYIPRRDPGHLRRNALIVLANVADVPIGDEVAATLARALSHPEGLVRAHAVWAVRRLGADELLDRCRHDSDEQVRAELARDVPRRAGSLVHRGRLASTEPANPPVGS